MSSRLLTFKEALREAHEIALQDPSVILIGEGVPDPKAIFGTTAGLKEKFPNQVFDMPVSENGMTGICIGAAINEMKPILVHQRMDFSLYSADQLINNAAKWYSMFGGQKSVPLVIRMIVGRGWGAGNQHSQNLTALFAHVPGLKIFCPSNASDAKTMLLAAVKDPNPVLFVEHRWLYETTSEMREEEFQPVPLCYSWNTLRQWIDEVTIVAAGHATLEALRARNFLAKAGVKASVVDLRSIKPLGMVFIKHRVKNTKNLIVVEDGWKFCGLGAEIIAQLAEDGEISFDAPPVRLTYPDYPSGSSPGLTANYYVGPYDIGKAVEKVLRRPLDLSELKSYQESRTHDVPDANFRGPF